MTSITFASAATLPLERVTQAFNLGFTGYYLPMSQTPDGLAQMIRENDVRLDISAVLFVNGELAGVGLVGVRDTRGWLAGMGVAPQWRGQGIGARLLGYLLSQMVAAGVRRAQLEVLEMNAPARTLYERMGFHTLRRLAVYHGPLRLGAAPPQRANAARVRSTPPRLALSGFSEYHTVAPAWQRERATLEHVRGSLDGLGLWDDGRLRAYLLFSRQRGGFAILDAGSNAASAHARRDDITLLLRALADPAPALTPAAMTSRCCCERWLTPRQSPSFGRSIRRQKMRWVMPSICWAALSPSRSMRWFARCHRGATIPLAHAVPARCGQRWSRM